MNASPTSNHHAGAVSAPLPANESSRIKKLLSYRVLDTKPEMAYDDIVEVAAQICETSVALVSLVDTSRQWFKATVGVDVTETPRDLAFCAHAILQPGVMVIPDALEDERFANNPLVVREPYIRFYAGAPLITTEGYALGTLCIIDTKPKQLSDTKIRVLEALARQVVSQLEIRLLLERTQQEVKARQSTEATLEAANEQLEQRVRERTQALSENNQQLKEALQSLQQAQAHLVHSEKMMALGQMLAGVAHEINNPVNFIHGNLLHLKSYTAGLIDFLSLYERTFPNLTPEIQQKADDLDIDFIKQDAEKILSSMKIGTERIREIVVSLRNFSRKDEAAHEAVDIHEGLESTLMILGHRLKAQPERPAINIVRNFEHLPKIECYAGQLNQVFMNILSNAIDAIDAKAEQDKYAAQTPEIVLRTEQRADSVAVCIADNALGMPSTVREHIFEPFFTTKPEGKGTGMGMAISHQLITERHGGKLECLSNEGVGTEFCIEIPIRLNALTA